MKTTPPRKRERGRKRRSKESQKAGQPPQEVSNSPQVDGNREKYPMRESVLISEKQHFQRILKILHRDFIVIDLELQGKITKEKPHAVQVLALMMLHIGRRKVENAYQQELQQSNQRFFPYFPFVIYLT